LLNRKRQKPLEKVGEEKENPPAGRWEGGGECGGFFSEKFTRKSFLGIFKSDKV